MMGEKINMAVRSKSIKFSNATITEDENGELIITEFTKDDSKENSLTEELKTWLEIDGISLTIKKDNKD